MKDWGTVSILMGIYNCETTLKEAIEAIQGQTYPNWELILCDDGSSDNTYKVAEEKVKEDDRIKLYRNSQNMGLNHTLNVCLEHAKGDYIARMDGDDDCRPDRLEKQLKTLEAHPGYDIVSSGMVLFDENGEWGKVINKEYPTCTDVVTGSPICHAPVLMRKECMDAVCGYTEDKRMLRVEDVNLWIKLYAAGYKCINIQEPLYRMRNDQKALQRRKYIYRINSTYVRLQGCRMLKLGPTSYLKSFVPMINGIVPAGLRQKIRHLQNR